MQCETLALRCLMSLVLTVKVLHLQLTTHQSPQEAEHTRLLVSLVLVVNGKAVQEKRCQNSVMSVALNTLWKMPSSAVNVE